MEELTKEEIQLLINVVCNVPIQGTLITLPEQLVRMTRIVEKLRSMLVESQEEILKGDN